MSQRAKYLTELLIYSFNFTLAFAKTSTPVIELARLFSAENTFYDVIALKNLEFST